jgi:hypothetical protein
MGLKYPSVHGKRQAVFRSAHHSSRQGDGKRMPGLALLDAPDRFALKSRWVRGARRCGASGTMTATTFRLLGVGAGEFTGATVEGSFARTPSFSGVDGRGAVLEPLRDVSPARLTKAADIVHSQPRPRELVADHFQARKPRYRDGEERAHHTSLVRRRVIVRLRPTGCALNLVFGPGVHRGQARRAREMECSRVATRVSRNPCGRLRSIDL